MWSVLVLLGLLLLMALLVGRFLGGKAAAAPDDLPYQRRATLLTPAERSFLGVLEQAVGARNRVQVQVRLADLMTVRAGLPAARRTAAQNRINGKHADFVLCDPDTLAIVAAIELDDASHRQAARRQRDDFLKSACAAAGLPLLRFEAKAAYSLAEVRHQLAAVVEPDAGSGPAQVELAAEAVDAAVEAGPPSAEPLCPRCGGAMVVRQVRQGAHAGKRLWGCRRYPACRGIVPLSA